MNPPKVQILEAGETLPVFWNRETMFFTNIHSLFFGNTSQRQELDKMVRGIDSYGSRMLSLFPLLYGTGKNLVVLELPPDPLLNSYFTRDLNLKIPDYCVLLRNDYDRLPAILKNEVNDSSLLESSALKKIMGSECKWVDGFVTDKILESIAELLGKKSLCSFAGSLKGNNKYDLHYQLEAKGLPVFATHSAENPREASQKLEELSRQGFSKGVIKAPIGASGCGIVITSTQISKQAELPGFLFFEGPCLVQGWVDSADNGTRVVSSPSVQLFAGDEGSYIFDITDQILSDQSVHEGNLSPPPHLAKTPELKQELIHQTKVAIEWLLESGYRGTASCDFLVTEKNGDLTAYLCEINARVTGATYPSLLGRHFNPRGAWLMRNLVFDPPAPGSEILKALDGPGILFKNTSNSGILPFNFSLNNKGLARKGQFVCLGENEAHVTEILKQAVQVLPGKGIFDRD